MLFTENKTQFNTHRIATLALAERKSNESQDDQTSSNKGSCERHLLYLAAAVSDFYIPNGELPVHKIQSSEGAPSIQVVATVFSDSRSSSVPLSCSVSRKCWSHLLSTGKEAVL